MAAQAIELLPIVTRVAVVNALKLEIGSAAR